MNEPQIEEMLAKMGKEVKMRAEWLNERKAPMDWLIITADEMEFLNGVIAKLNSELNEARASQSPFKPFQN